MKHALLLGLLGGLLTGCFRTRVERRDVPVDTGTVLVFGDEQGPELEWEFGDGSPKVTARQVKKAFARGGHYTVRGVDGERLRWQIDLDAIPRPVTRAVPPDAEWAVYSPQLKADFIDSLDFFERVLGASNLQSLIDGWVLPTLAVDSSVLGRIVDPLEGIGAFTLPGIDATVVLLGVTDELAALDELTARSRGLDLGDGARAIETRDGAPALVFADRGYLFAVLPKTAEAGIAAVRRVRAADGRGLESAPVFAALGAATGRVVVLGAPKNQAELPIEALWATVTLDGAKAQLQGRLFSKDLFWQSQGQAPAAALLGRAWEGPVAAVSLKLPVALVRRVLLEGSEKREASRMRLLAHGIDIERMAKALTGDVAGLVWFDAEGFIRTLVEGSPAPRGAAHVEVAVTDGATWAGAIAQMLEVLLPARPNMKQQGGSTEWSTRLAGQDTQLTVGAKVMHLEVGSGLKGRTLVDLGGQLSQRFEGAFGKGHASLMLDLGRLKAELETPRMIEGLDAMKVVTVQGFASAFLDRYTPIDHVLFDLAPLPDGAKLTGRVVLRNPER
ncbi:MAG: hypothetical protein JNK82_36330 [Myxococcaceae bacterium]|nr:hypothetical protein [Myxococcaceae bacterium]